MVRQRVAQVGDGMCFGLIGLAALVDVTGGLRVGRGWYRFSATDPVHLLYVAIGVALVRHLVIWRPTLRARLAARWPTARNGAMRTIATPTTWRDLGLITVVMTVATLVLLHDQVGEITGVGDRGDPLFSMWRLAWIGHQLLADPRHLFDANIFFNTPGTFAYSDATLLAGLVAAPFLWAGVPVAAVHGLLYVASFALAGVTMAVLARAVTGQLAPALVAGLMFAFMPYRFATYSHLEMQGVFLMPLALVWLLRAIDTGRARDGALAGAMVALQCLWSLYLGAYLVVGLTVVVAGCWLTGFFSLRARLATLAIAVLVAGAVLAPYSRPYWNAHQTVGDRGRQEVEVGSATLTDYSHINEANGLWGPHSSQDVNAERQLFPGAAPLLLALTALVPPAGPVALAAGAAAVVSVDATLGLHGLVFPSLYDVAPPFRAFRVPARFAMVTGLFLSLLAGVGLARMLGGSNARWTRPVAGVIAGFALLEIRPVLTLTPVSTMSPPLYAPLNRDPGAVLVELPIAAADDAFWTDPSYLYASTFHWHPLLNGYSGFAPPEYARLQQASREMPSDAALSVFRSAGARYLAVHEEFYRGGQYRVVVDALDRRGDVMLVMTTRDASGESRLYRFL